MQRHLWQGVRPGSGDRRLNPPVRPFLDGLMPF
jgi:hypothetical protein